MRDWRRLKQLSFLSLAVLIFAREEEESSDEYSIHVRHESYSQTNRGKLTIQRTAVESLQIITGFANCNKSNEHAAKGRSDVRKCWEKEWICT